MKESTEDINTKQDMILGFINEVKKLDLPSGKYTVVGGGALTARGIRKTSDIDLMLSEDLYEYLKREGWEEREKIPGHFHLYRGSVEAAKDFSHISGCQLDSVKVIQSSEMIEGVPVMSLEDLIKLKEVMGREKDVRDIELIREHTK